MESMIYSACILFYLFCFITGSSTSTFSQMVKSDNKPLIVGQELWKETLPLKMGARMYQLQGLKPQTRYEVKISYPASIPARFTIQLKTDSSDRLGMNQNRRLLNTEKLIFKTDSLHSDKIKLYVLVTVEPEGVVAILNVPERENIIFNIVCDELIVGIPHKAWQVGVMVLLCLALAIIIPRFLPSWLLPKNSDTRIARQSLSKES